MNIAEAVKKCALEAFAAEIPCDVVFGVVTGEEPLCVQCGEMLISGEVLSVAEHIKKREYELTIGGYERTVVINEGIGKGDCVALLRQKGGECYVAFAKIGREMNYVT